jgi:hypothetical protein
MLCILLACMLEVRISCWLYLRPAKILDCLKPQDACNSGAKTNSKVGEMQCAKAEQFTQERHIQNQYQDG